MSDDTTTWLKKNPAANPLRRSLKTSLRFHVSSSDMNASILSNPDKVKDQGLFIPRMLQKSTMQMRKSRASEFKVPEMMVKPLAKKENGGAEVKHKRIPTPSKMMKSLLPVAKQKGQVPAEKPVKSNLPRPSFFPGGSAKRMTAKRELIKKAVELSALKRKEEAESQAKAAAAAPAPPTSAAVAIEDSAVLRSILKKRASLRRASQISAKKPKAKKVLFDGFDDSEGEKENAVTSEESQNDFNTALDEPTVYLNFPNGVNLECPFEEDAIQPEDATATATATDLSTVMALWEAYKDNLKDMQTERTTLEDSLQSLVQHSLNFQKEYKAYKETSDEMLERLSRLGREIEESLMKVKEGMSGGRGEGAKAKRRSSEGGRGSDKIKMSQKSKAIRRNSGRKSVPVTKVSLRDMEDSFSVLCRDNA